MNASAMRIWALILAGALALAGCGLAHSPALHADRDAAPAHRRGELVSLQAVETLDRAGAQRIASGLPGAIAVDGGARLYRVEYRTVYRNRPVVASGLFSTPSAGGRSKGTVLYLHGTQASRAASPSQPGRADGNEETAVFAGNGFDVAVPDYIGLGVSNEPQAYAIVAVQVDAALDLLRAVRAASAELHRGDGSPSLYVLGFSQGGQSAAGVHRALERAPLDGYRLRGSIGIAGPYDLRALLLRKLAPESAGSANDAGYLAFIAQAYSAYYGHPLNELLADDYAATMPALFDGSQTPDRIGAALPADARALLRPEFLRSLRAGRESWFTRALDENQTFAWTPVAPFRIHYGEADRDVPPRSAQALFDYAKARGGNVSLHSMGAVDHSDSAALSYAPALAWFEQLGAMP
ncbi:alpha/beta hydrolase family protein [Lysobacter enzymogenes]|uniref:alpha/beta hydrolase family protein n=1 Tax=Lysobacter enzymogenes TaxID=69 RepID=UPI001A96A1D5|nr:hypothetical protein [Lysobacter enzymogenes]QQP97397.1 hypothetical protein JHW38_04990 [Lysobacter enzymogenes]